MRMGKIILVIGLSCVVLVGSAIGGGFCALKQLIGQKYNYLNVEWNDSVGTIVKDLTYGERPLNNYDLYLPADSGKDGYSLICYIHGGGFTGGDKYDSGISRYGQYFASKGYIMASINYTLTAKDVKADLNLMYEELVAAINEVVRYCAEQGYHITELATTGESAGGCLAMLTAFRNPERLCVPVRFVFQQTGPACFDPTLWGNADAKAQADFVNMMTGKTFTEEDVGTPAFQAAIDEISPCAHVNENTVPVILAYGPNDKVVPPVVKLPLLEALEKCGVVHDFIEFPNSGHGLLSDSDKMQAYYQTMEDYFGRYFTN